MTKGSVFALLLYGLLATQSLAANLVQKVAPLFWQLQFNGQTSYALGSIHLGNASLYPLPAKIMADFNRSDALGSVDLWS